MASRFALMCDCGDRMRLVQPGSRYEPTMGLYFIRAVYPIPQIARHRCAPRSTSRSCEVVRGGCRCHNTSYAHIVRCSVLRVRKSVGRVVDLVHDKRRCRRPPTSYDQSPAPTSRRRQKTPPALRSSPMTDIAPSGLT